MVDDVDPKLVGDLLGLVVHDLRNPLSALHSNIGYLVALSETTDEESRGALDDAMLSCEALDEIIDNLELFAHALGRHIRISDAPLHPLPLASVISELVHRYERMALGHGVKLELEHTPPGDVRVETRGDMLLRALGNLLKNAIQHAPSGSAVRLGAWLENGMCVLRVSDSGPPLEPALKEMAFTAAGQLAAKVAAGGRYGRGLGLLCARIAVREARGVMRAVDTAAGGNVFELSLELAQC
jgi:signal transduction histidine kinase